MKSVSIKDYCLSNGIAAISNVRENTNGYKYVTLIDNERNGNNIYFTKNSNEEVSVGDSPRVIKDSVVLTVQNEAGEERLKISLNAEYAQVAELW